MIGEVSSEKAWTAQLADLLPKIRRSRQEKDSRSIFLSFFQIQNLPVFVPGRRLK
jgi:hypothetical protein